MEVGYLSLKLFGFEAQKLVELVVDQILVELVEADHLVKFHFVFEEVVELEVVGEFHLIP